MKKKILIAVKTYPLPSTKYTETVCTAGFDKDGNWIRIYPIPFRLLYGPQQYKKYDWIEGPVRKNTQDPRLESHKIIYKEIKVVGELSTADNWKARKEIVLKNGFRTDLTALIKEAKETNISLATYKPKQVINFIWKKSDEDYSEKALKDWEESGKQLSLFQDENDAKLDFKLVKKIPYKFSYVFEDADGTKRTVMIEDWEVGAAYFNFQEKYRDTSLVLEKMRDKFLTQMLKKDLYFFLGTTRKFHKMGKNPFIIIGLFYPPVDNEPSLL